MSTIAELIAAIPPVHPFPVRKPALPYLCCGAPCIGCGIDLHGDWGLVPDMCEQCDANARIAQYQDMRHQRDAQLRVAYEALTNARSALLDAAPMRTVAPDIEELDMALAAIKPPMDTGEQK